ncbi:Dyp-type peroxidase [Streptomyces aidingensis]|uniref:Dyp-type peroxidase family n=1 Tax=Streptomyces aidingensis TaxID=910347 RepID=A0A1I1NY45_9ACTN|nr:Dyp-type peroxidase [Streptomyces aidingensis]SFD02385.1 Dyp-type peroxidase family [Streptomyces aidingensis]
MTHATPSPGPGTTGTGTATATTALPRQPGDAVHPADHRPADPGLPLRESTEIQGDIIAGFKKDHAQFLFLRFGELPPARRWLNLLRHRIATTLDVSLYNEEFRRGHAITGGADPERKKAIWRCVSFTAAGLRFLTGDPALFGDCDAPALVAFREGSAVRAGRLGDTGVDAPEHWLFSDGARDAEHTVHAVLTLAADEAEDLRSTLSWERKDAASHQIAILFEQDGATLPGTRRGREHFGFKDGVSEPAVRGFDEPDPGHPHWKRDRPGTRLIPAGEFVIGHERVQPRGGDGPLPAAPELPGWMTNGSFQVVRRLGQDVPGWWAQITEQLQVLKEQRVVPAGTTVEWLAARLVGRWRSGVPVHKSPDADRPANADLSRDNDISYANDPEGRITPLFSHLRKTSPRDGLRLHPDSAEFEKEATNLDGRRIIRRGIPYGEPFDPAAGEKNGPDAPRGLVFVCYQSDLVAQFEFIQEGWIEAKDFPHRSPSVGRDPLCGSDTTVAFPDSEDLGTKGTVPLRFRQFVRTEGSVYAFCPSLHALEKLADGTLLEEGDRVIRAPFTLNAGDPPLSSGKAQLRLQADGNLTVHNEHQELVWESHTGGNGGVRLTLQADGRLAIRNAFDELLWTKPARPVPGSVLVIRADGNVALTTEEGQVLWDTDTAH